MFNPRFFMVAAGKAGNPEDRDRLVTLSELARVYLHLETTLPYKLRQNQLRRGQRPKAPDSIEQSVLQEIDANLQAGDQRLVRLFEGLDTAREIIQALVQGADTPGAVKDWQFMLDGVKFTEDRVIIEEIISVQRRILQTMRQFIATSPIN